MQPFLLMGSHPDEPRASRQILPRRTRAKKIRNSLAFSTQSFRSIRDGAKAMTDAST
jgi:hypothetical protein